MAPKPKPKPKHKAILMQRDQAAAEKSRQQKIAGG